MRLGDRQILRTGRVGSPIVRHRHGGQRGAAEPDVAAGQTVVIAEVMVDAPQVGVVFGGLGQVVDVVQAARGQRGVGRQRIELEQFFRNRVDHGGALRSGRNHCSGGRGIGLFQRFPAIEEKRLAAPEGTAQRSAVLIAVQRILGTAQLVGEEVGRLQLGVAQKLEQAAVELVISAFGNHVDLRAGLPAEFDRRRGGDHAQFLNGFRDAEVGHGAGDLRIQPVDPVDHPVGGLHARARGGDAVDLRTGRGESRSGREQRQIVKAAIHQRKAGGELGIEVGTGGAALRFNQRRDAAGDFDSLGHLADGQLDVHRDNLIDQHGDGSNGFLAESAGLDDDRISSGSEIAELVKPGVVRGGFLSDVGEFVLELYAGVRDHRTG